MCITGASCLEETGAFQLSLSRAEGQTGESSLQSAGQGDVTEKRQDRNEGEQVPQVHAKTQRNPSFKHLLDHADSGVGRLTHRCGTTISTA